ncbi:MAG: hypothetical protein A2004_08525 [Spirochaetes bacterium GWC1_61_12]|nr:MAG: hypothetical protein A2004_08525 [Spirochaetes bacterium GWC1_61_12]HAX38294.1 hypothetical protein [Spirochaetaceae bacterium]
MALLCGSLILAASLAWPTLHIASNRFQGELYAQRSFLALQSAGQRLLAHPSAVADQAWQQHSRQFFQTEHRLLAITVRASEQGLVYALPLDSPFLPLTSSDADGRPADQFTAPAFSTSRFSTLLPGGLQLEALYVTVSQEQVFRALLETLVGLLLLSIGLAAALLVSPRPDLTPVKLVPTIELTNAAPRPVPSDSRINHPTDQLADQPAAATTDSETTVPNKALTDDQGSAVSLADPSLAAAATPAATAVSETTAPSQPDSPASGLAVADLTATAVANGVDLSTDAAATATDESLPDLPYLDGDIEDVLALAEPVANNGQDDGLAISEPHPNLASTRADSVASTPASPSDQPAPKRIPVVEEDIGGPKGLYDPGSGLCWESYLRERLNAELRRAATFEQDLVLLLASWDSVKKYSLDYETFTATVRDFFNFKDLSFAFGEDGVAVVLPNSDIDETMRHTEELIKKLTFVIQDRTSQLKYLEVFMGLSSRSGRIVDAERVIAEALVALRKARIERDTHIMAFRPDPEKYRSFLTNH